MIHIIERFFIHMVSATFITLAIYYTIRFWVKTNAKVGNFISSRRNHLVVLSAILVFALLPLREPYDIAFGTQVWYKAITDQISWFIGAAIAGWGLIRFTGE
jgi:hypothetical protein